MNIVCLMFLNKLFNYCEYSLLKDDKGFLFAQDISDAASLSRKKMILPCLGSM